MTRERRGMIPRASYMVNITEFLFFSARENRVNKKEKKSCNSRNCEEEPFSFIVMIIRNKCFYSRGQIVIVVCKTVDSKDYIYHGM